MLFSILIAVLPLFAIAWGKKPEVADHGPMSSGHGPNIGGPGPEITRDGKYLINSTGISAYFIPYGASLSNLFLEDIHGIQRDIVLGFDNASYYHEADKIGLHPHLNGVPGRYANRIKNGTFTIDGVTYHTDLNENGLDTLHGGADGWDYRDWTVVAHTADSITFSLVDPDGKEGFPGEVVSYVTYSVSPFEWHISMTAIATTKKTPIMLSSHTYWNLDAFQNPNTPTALNYTLFMPFSGQRVAIDNIEIPTGDILANKQYGVQDFWSAPKQLGANISSPDLLGQCGWNCTGYDNCYVFNRDAQTGFSYDWKQAPVVQIASPWSGIQVDIYTDQRAFQIYTCNNMNGTFPLKETQGFFNDSSKPRVTEQYGCLVMEVEDWIDAINQPEWGRDSLQIFGPGDGPYTLEACYKFSVNRELAGAT